MPALILELVEGPTLEDVIAQASGSRRLRLQASGFGLGQLAVRGPEEPEAEAEAVTRSSRP